MGYLKLGNLDKPIKFFDTDWTNTMDELSSRIKRNVEKYMTDGFCTPLGTDHGLIETVGTDKIKITSCPNGFYYNGNYASLDKDKTHSMPSEYGEYYVYLKAVEDVKTTEISEDPFTKEHEYSSFAAEISLVKDTNDHEHKSEHGVLCGKIIIKAISDGTYKKIEITRQKSTLKKGVYEIADDTVIESKIPDEAIKTAKVADGAITTPKIANEAIKTAKVADGAITTPKIANGAITTDKIPDNTIIRAKVADDAITTNKIANGAITKDKVDSEAITTPKIANGAITKTKVADNAIKTAKIANGAITPPKLKYEYAKIWHELDVNRHMGIGGGEAKDNAWTTRELNKIDTNIAGLKLDKPKNEFTLPKGIYKIRASAPAIRVQKHTFRIKSDRGKTINGSWEYSDIESVQTRSHLIGVLNISSDDNFKLEHYVLKEAPNPKETLGVASSNRRTPPTGLKAIYAQIFIEKVG